MLSTIYVVYTKLVEEDGGVWMCEQCLNCTLWVHVLHYAIWGTLSHNTSTRTQWVY